MIQVFAMTTGHGKHWHHSRFKKFSRHSGHFIVHVALRSHPTYMPNIYVSCDRSAISDRLDMSQWHCDDYQLKK